MKLYYAKFTRICTKHRNGDKEFFLYFAIEIIDIFSNINPTLLVHNIFQSNDQHPDQELFIWLVGLINCLKQDYCK